MVFSSNIFLFFFLPFALAGYFFMKEKYRNYFLLLISLIFYAYGEGGRVLLMLLVIFISWLGGLLLTHTRSPNLRKLWLALTLILNLSALIFYKYLGFGCDIFQKIIPSHTCEFSNSITLPIGISFFTFQAISYLIDVYRRQVTPQRNPLFLGLYISFFPQLIAGPIVRYVDITKQLVKRKITSALFSEGVQKFIIGLAKKVILANNLGLIADSSFNSTMDSRSILLSWLGALAYMLQIYFDFSGYSDMAIGLGKMFGFNFHANFNYPYLSKSISEFWRRWHISLGTWFRDYIYFPLGGSRVGQGRLVFNLLLVWFLTGLWHGANWTFIIWGMFYGALIIFEKLTSYPSKLKNKFALWLYRFFTLACIFGGWIIFRSENLRSALQYIQSMFGGFDVPLINKEFLFQLHEGWIFILLGIIGSTNFIVWSARRLKTKLPFSVADFGQLLYLFFIFIWSVSFLVVGGHNPFIYFNF
jgi:D-alanyl-lipoteichoic acid acyltransferase DltB (MBOAT superfamily)